MEASAVSGPRRPAMAQMRTFNSQRQISRADHTRSTRKPAAWRKITRLGRSRRGRDGDQRLCLVLRRQCASSGTSAHPQPLMLPAFLTHATSHVRRISSVLEVAPAGSRQGSLQRCRPLIISLCQAPHLIGSQAKITEHLPKRSARIDGCQKLPPHLNR